MPITIKNWKLAILALIGITFLTSLGFWQINRGLEKKILLKTYSDRTNHSPLLAKDIQPNQDLRFYPVHLEGEFDQAHTFLLDNKTFKGQVGYEIYTPFKANHLSTPILIDRGFIPMGGDRKQLPKVNPPSGPTTIRGTLNLPPRYVALGPIYESLPITWPLRIEFIHISEMNTLLTYTMPAYLVQLNTPDAGVVLMTPERHWGYAVQWFALALTLLILFAILNGNHRND